MIKKIMKTPSLLFSTLLFGFFFLPLTSLAQDMDAILGNDDFAKALAEEMNESDSSVGANSPSKEIYQDNSIRQMGVVDKEMMESAWQRDQLDQMRSLATKLCALDQRSCYLIENYRKFASEDINTLSLDDLKLFGTDIFSTYSLSFDAIDDAPVPDSYIINTGDILKISTIKSGGQSSVVESQVMRDGSILIKGIGQISIAGKNYSDAIKEIQLFVQDTRVGSITNVTMMKARTMNVFVLGATNRAGSYRVGAQASVLNVLSAVGGLEENASLRFIEVHDGSKLVDTVDLYQPLIYGSIDNSLFLADGYSILIPAAKNIVTIFGEINRPAKYEIKEGETLSKVLDFSLGYKVYADRSSFTVKRKNSLGHYDVLSIVDASSFILMNGDIIIVNQVKGDEQSYISFHGALRNPGMHAFNATLNFSDYLNPTQDLLNKSYPGFIVQKSFNNKTKGWNFKSYSLTDQGSINSIKIAQQDHFYIFSYDDIQFLSSREINKLIQNKSNDDVKKIQFSSIDESQNTATESFDNTKIECIKEITKYADSSFIQKYKNNINLIPQNNSTECPEIFIKFPEVFAFIVDEAIPVFGAVRSPGLYPIADGTSITDVLSIAGGSRGKGNAQIEFAYKDNSQSYSYVKVKNEYANRGLDTITLTGQFKNPGVYQIGYKETISQVVLRAGGLMGDAYPLGAIYTRESIKIAEQQALEKASKELADLLSTAITSGFMKQDSADLMNLMAFMNQANTIQASGRMIADLDIGTIKNTKNDFFVMPGDVLYMPKRPHSVTISGNVLNSVTVSYDPELSYKDYISLAGGFKDNGSKKNTFIILPNGKTIKPTNTLFSNNNSFILPGSTIIVPREARPLSGLSLVEVLSPTLANLSVTAASIAAISKD